MANIPLQSITFPGLVDKYTTPTVDATLTQTGAAADAKKTGDEIGAIKNDLSEKADKTEALSAYIVETATGSIASFTDGADDVPVKDLTVAIEPVQSGSGDPSPSNVRPISGWTGANVTVNDEVLSVNWQTEAGTVYGGTLDVTTGKLVVNHALLAVNDSATIARQVGRTDYYFNVVASGLPVSEINTGIISNVLKPLPFGGSSGIWQGNEGCCLREGMFTFYANATKNMELNEAKQWLIDNEAEIYCPLANPVTYQLTPQEVRTLLGQNNIFADCGDVTAQYRADTKLYIDKVLNA